METNHITPNPAYNGKTMAGIIIVIIGGILLVDQFDLFFIPHWLFSWPMWIIAYGLYMGGKYNFQKPVWIWLTAIGVAFLLNDNIDNAGQFIWPMGIMGVGAWMIFKHNHKQVNAQYTNTDNIKI